MDNDDRPIGRILSRREVLALLGTGGAALLVGCGPQQTSTNATVLPTESSAGTTAAPTLNAEAATAVTLADPTAAATQAAAVATAVVANTAVADAAPSVPACVVRPEVTEGPYYVDVGLVRSDVRSDSASGEVKAGTPLVLTFNVSQVSASSCTPLQGATVEIWHCDAEGQYSGVSDRSFDTTGQNWLRGAQITDANGIATFTTIYPGWYPGRAVHIHFAVAPDASSVFTSQLFFDEALTEQVLQADAYSAKSNVPDTLNSTDNIFEELLLLDAVAAGEGYAATFAIGIDPNTIGSAEGGRDA
jgi:protocatechuate 3,4-dioxygenase beta subunit